MKICETFPPCVEDPSKCGHSIDCSSFDDYENGEPTRFIGGIGCPYAKWKEIDGVKEIGHTDEPIETSKFPAYKPNCNLISCRYNTDGKCENEEKRKECVEVSRYVLCLDEKEKKNKIKYPKTLEDCKEIFNKDGQWRYAVVSCKDEKPIYICQTYEDAKEMIGNCWKYGNPISKIVDLMYTD